MPSGSYFEVEPGLELYYEDRGHGDPLVFVPGWTVSTGAFLHQFSHFSKTNRVISFDPRSQGRSTVTLQGNDYTTQSADLSRLLDYLELKNPVLIGWSFGCLPLWGLMRLRDTASLGGLVFIDMPPTPVSDEEDDWRDLSHSEAAELYQALTTPKAQREIVSAYTQEVMVQRDLTAEELDWIVGLFTNSPHWIASAYWASAITSDYLKEAQEVDRSLPSLFVVAEHRKDQAKRYIERQFPKARAEFLGGHMMFWEYPEEFNAILEAFLKDLS